MSGNSEQSEVRTARRTRPRSPSYPAIGLAEAIERAGVLHAKEGRNAAPFEAVLHHWGYSPKSGAGSVVLAALRKYDLLIYEGKTGRLSDLAFRILWDEEDSPDRRDAIQVAALNPRIHAELWEQYRGSLPSDATLKLELRKRGFAESAISNFIDQFRSTLTFAGLINGGRVDESYGGTPAPWPVSPMPSSPVDYREMSGRSRIGPGAPAPIQLPLVGGTVVTIQASGPVSETAWDQMMEVLKTLKPGFVAPPSAESVDHTD